MQFWRGCWLRRMVIHQYHYLQVRCPFYAHSLHDKGLFPSNHWCHVLHQQSAAYFWRQFFKSVNWSVHSTNTTLTNQWAHGQINIAQDSCMLLTIRIQAETSTIPSPMEIKGSQLCGRWLSWKLNIVTSQNFASQTPMYNKLNHVKKLKKGQTLGGGKLSFEQDFSLFCAIYISCSKVCKNAIKN